METKKMKEFLKERAAGISKKTSEFSKKTSEFTNEKLNAISKEKIQEFAKDKFSKAGVRKFLNELKYDKEKRLAVFYSVFYFVFISGLLVAAA